MSNQTDNKKKSPIVKIVLWVVGIIVALQVLSGGEFLEDVFETKDTGAQRETIASSAGTRKAYFGLSGQDTEENAGVLVTKVSAGGPAEAAGIQVGDVITALGSHSVGNSADFKQAMALYDPWETVDISLVRNGEEMTLSITLGEKAEAATQSQQNENQQQNTAPPQSDAPVKDQHPLLPGDLREHVLIGSRDSGVSATLTGDVLITVIFVNDPTSQWTQEKVDSTKAGDAAMTAEILAEAQSYGANLNITMEYRQATVNITEEADAKAWADQIIAGAGLGSRTDASAELERSKGVKEAPILFYVNAQERSYALPSGGGETEYAIIWNCGSDTVTYRHELFHLFGAADYYMPKAVADCAQRYYPNSTMLTDVEAKTDDLTAYLIGWTDAPSDSALAFLRDTAYVTQEMVSQEYKKNTHTGYVENWERDGDYITGYLDFGILEGPGKIVCANGGWYEGDFEYGQCTGRGKIIYDDGGWYEGDLVKGICEGHGTIVWADGSNYTGQWKNSQYHGKGKSVHADGSWYEGDFVNGTYDGYGTMVWADGTSYTGQWKANKHNGKGKCVYANGSWYEGDFVNDAFDGQGTYVWADGANYAGQWKNNQQHGKGRLVYSDGSWYEGDFAYGSFNGWGTFTWADGTSRSGNWKDGNYIE